MEFDGFEVGAGFSRIVYSEFIWPENYKIFGETFDHNFDISFRDLVLQDGYWQNLSEILHDCIFVDVLQHFFPFFCLFLFIFEFILLQLIDHFKNPIELFEIDVELNF
jgi:hypothetical protein